MSQGLYRYTFPASVCFDDVMSLLDLALFSAQAIHGATAMRLDARYFGDRTARVLVVDACTPIGRDLNRLFESHARRQLGTDGFQIKRLERRPDDDSAVAAPGRAD